MLDAFGKSGEGYYLVCFAEAEGIYYNDMRHAAPPAFDPKPRLPQKRAANCKIYRGEGTAQAVGFLTTEPSAAR